ERQADVGGQHAGKLDLRLLGRLPQTLHGLAILGQVDAVLVPELLHQPVDDALVEVVAAQAVVAAGGLHFEDAVADFENGNVKGAAAQVKNEDRLVVLFVQPVRQRRGRGLVDDAEHFQPGDGSRVFGRL